MPSLNNHYKNLWDNKAFYNPERINYDVDFDPHADVIDFRAACLENARLIYQNHKNLNLFLSGGFDSQIVALSFFLLNIPVNIKILKYDDNINEFDYKAAIKLCQSYNIDYEVINFDIENFLDNDILKYGDDFGSQEPHYCLVYKLLKENSDKVNIFGLGDFDFKYNKKYDKFYMIEYEFTGRLNQLCDNFIKFYHYSPIILRSWLEDSNVKKFITSRPIKMGWDNFKNIFYLTHFPELSWRKKYNGYEPILNKFRETTSKLESQHNYMLFRLYTYENFLSMSRGN